MARPRKRRSVCCVPESTLFGPLKPRHQNHKVIVMAVDEYEAIRLIDLEGLTQQECSERMGVARTTVQGIYSSARKKLSQSLVQGNLLRIEGGNYRLYNDNERKYGCGRCRGRGRGRRMSGQIMENNKRRIDMRVAMPVNEESMEKGISSSFGRAPYFLVYDIETDKAEFIENNAMESQGGAGIVAAQLILDNRVSALITPRCGEKAAQVMKMGKVNLYKSMDGNIEENIEAFKDGGLSPLDHIHLGFHGQDEL